MIDKFIVSNQTININKQNEMRIINYEFPPVTSTSLVLEFPTDSKLYTNDYI